MQASSTVGVRKLVPMLVIKGQMGCWCLWWPELEIRNAPVLVLWVIAEGYFTYAAPEWL